MPRSATLTTLGIVIAASCLTVGACGGGEEAPPGAESYTLHSRLLGRDLEQTVVFAGRGRPLLVFLHGRGAGPDQVFGEELDAALRALGPRAPNLLFPAGGDSSYWHDRRDGPWGRYVLAEAVPAAVRRLNADARRVAIGGFSMGGFGALDLARLHPGRFCAVGGHAAALWRTGGETPAGAFDDAEDFSRHDVLGAAARGWPFGRTRVWLDVGRDDPFRAADGELARRLGRRANFTLWPGEHDVAYVERHLRRTLRFYAAALAACRP